jgi:adenosine kinase
MSVILGMGNPLLDISAPVDKKLLEKYGLKDGDAILAEEKHQPLFAEMAKQKNVQYIAGGATQNTIRVAQWMLQTPGATAYMGCVGKDENGTLLKKACEKDGVTPHYMVDEKTPTGVCAAPICGVERSLCTNLGAANNYNATHCQQPENWKVVEGAKIIYSAGFFITVSTESIKLASREQARTDQIYCLNLSAPFLMQVPPFKACFVDTMPYVDFLFCNETEAMTWAETEGWETTDVSMIATRLSLIPSLKSRKRTVVITQGRDPTIVAVNGHVTKHPITVLAKEKLVDTNGAGDSYVGGFLAALSKGLPLDACCKAGAYAASVIVQHSGCTFPAKRDYKFETPSKL